jgi:two-component system, NarL family, sensor kinase
MSEDYPVQGRPTPIASPVLLKRRLAITLIFIVSLACLLALALVFITALRERQALRSTALSSAVALSFGFDQEVAAVNYLLKGLSRSPALASGDIRSFYEQMKATPTPEGSWLILQNLEGQVANTLRPFEDPTLPKHKATPNYQEQIDRIRDRGWSVSGRQYGLVKQAVVIALSLRINGEDGAMKYFITTILSDVRLSAIMADQTVPSGWAKALYDRGFQPIVTKWEGRSNSFIDAPPAMKRALADLDPNTSVTGVVEDVDEAGNAVVVAYRRSGATNWTSAVILPLDAANDPIFSVAKQVIWPACCFLFLIGLASLMTMRQFERPIKIMSGMVADAKSEVVELSAQLLALQEEERQRIAS